MFFKKTYFYAAATLLIAVGLVPCYAQKSPGQPRPTIRLKKPEASSGRNMVDYNAQAVDQPPHLASLPDYPGQARYISGTCYPHENGSVTYNLWFGAKENPQQIYDWYENALMMQKSWNLKKASNSIRALSKDGNFCNITVGPGRMRGEKSTIIIIYGLAHR